jgi:hypothetical protein
VGALVDALQALQQDPLRVDVERGHGLAGGGRELRQRLDAAHLEHERALGPGQQLVDRRLDLLLDGGQRLLGRDELQLGQHGVQERSGADDGLARLRGRQLARREQALLDQQLSEGQGGRAGGAHRAPLVHRDRARAISAGVADVQRARAGAQVDELEQLGHGDVGEASFEAHAVFLLVVGVRMPANRCSLRSARA